MPYGLEWTAAKLGAPAPSGSSALSRLMTPAATLVEPVIAALNKGRRRDLKHRAEQIQNLSRLREQNYALEGLAEDEAETNRRAERDPYAAKARLANIGAAGGSQEKQILEDQKRTVALRLNAIQRARTRM